MKKYLILLVAIVLIFSASYLYIALRLRDSLSTSTDKKLNTVTYACNEGKTITAIFYETAQKPISQPGEPPIPNGRVEVTLSDGRFMNLPQTISASGIRYANSDESFVFWGKGNGALVLEHNVEKSYIGCIAVAPEPVGSNLSKIYANGQEGFSIRLPETYQVDELYEYQIAPQKVIAGVKFTIPKVLAEGTNLSEDSYISVESIPQTQECTADLFFYDTKSAKEEMRDNTTYSVAHSVGAAAGNRYEETVFALPGTNPCMAVRYLIHSTVLENYEPGAVRQFDRQMLLDQFDAIRRTFIIN